MTDHGWEADASEWVRQCQEDDRFEMVAPLYWEPTRDALAALDAVRAELAEALSIIMWMSGSDDFAPGGDARKGFENWVLPFLATAPKEAPDA